MSADQDSVLLENAKQRVQKLPEEYVNSIGKSCKISWTMGEDNDASASNDSQADQNTDGK